MKELKFYVYVYCNPLKQGNYSYMENGIGIDFDYEPFYIGKGCGIRLSHHVDEAKNYYKIEEDLIQEQENKKINLHKINTINKILRNNQEIIIYKIYENLNEETAYLFERFFIKLIGRSDLKLGPLTNMTNGGEGIKNLSKKVMRRRIQRYKKTLEENPEIIENRIKKYKKTLKENPEIAKNRSEKYKKTLEENPKINLTRSLKSKATTVDNNLLAGKNNPKYIEINSEFLIQLYFSKISFLEMCTKYRNTFNTSIKNSCFSKFFKILNFPINSLSTFHPKKKEIYIQFLEENKDKIDWYIENYRRLEKEYFIKI